MAAPTRVSATPSAHNSGTDPKTVSVSPLTGDLLVVRAVNENASRTFTAPTSSGLTFTGGPNVGTTGSTCRCAIWTAPVTTGGTYVISMGDGVHAEWWGFIVSIWRNHGGVGASGNANPGTTGAPAISITTTGANSGIDFLTGDFNAIDGTTRTYRSVNGSAATEDNYFRDSAHYALYEAYHPDAGAAGTVSVGESAPSGQKYSGVAIEILSGADASAASPPLQRRFPHALLIR